ncbi:MAG: hypothetical protein RMJ17_03645 [Candidatus Aenigmarchaeota archaeon]|nr:hypothetical protein [Candidatus Aenigmarchaeota archaeon]MDW8149657.1 hypothetical protein [Candidatus Aenigmarchaeota archaeon]
MKLYRNNGELMICFRRESIGIVLVDYSVTINFYNEDGVLLKNLVIGLRWPFLKVYTYNYY